MQKSADVIFQMIALTNNIWENGLQKPRTESGCSPHKGSKSLKADSKLDLYLWWMTTGTKSRFPDMDLLQLCMTRLMQSLHVLPCFRLMSVTAQA